MFLGLFALVKKVLELCTWPFRLLGVLLAAIILVGCWYMWSIPNVASKYNLDPFDVVLRCLDNEQSLDPYYLLDGKDAIDQAIVKVQAPREQHMTGKIERIDTEKRGPHQHLHTVHVQGKGTFTLETTTPHLTVKPESLAQARRGLETLFPTKNKADWEQLRKWGEGLFVVAWERKNSSYSVPLIQPVRGSEEEHLFCAWQMLRGGIAEADQDLPQMQQLAWAAFPDPAAHQAALSWAQTLYERNAANLEDFHLRYPPGNNTEENTPLAKKRVLTIVQPPPGDFTRCWLLYQYVGLTDASRKAARERWLRYFAPGKEKSVLAWGKKLDAERREAGEPLPPSSETVELVCVIERLTGQDGYGVRCRQAVAQTWSPVQRSTLMAALQTAYPNDDFFYLLASEDRLQLHSTGNARLLVYILLIGLVSLGLRTWLFTVLAGWILGLRNNPVFQAYRNERGRVTWMGRLVSYVLLPVIGWVFAWLTLPPTLDLQVRSAGHLFVGVYASLMFGGTVIALLSRLIAILLIKLGVDVNRVWLDEILATVAGAYVLRHFGNDWLAILVFVAFDLAPMGLEWWQRQKLAKAGYKKEPAPEAAGEWYIQQDGRQLGPVTTPSSRRWHARDA